MLSLAETLKTMKGSIASLASRLSTFYDDSVKPKPENTGTALSAGQVVRTDGAGRLTANDLLKAVRAAGTSAEIAELAAQPITLKETFLNWQRISCFADGTSQNDSSASQVTARSCYYYDETSKAIICPNNSDPFSAFVSPEEYEPDYRIKYSIDQRVLSSGGGDDDGLAFIAGFMTDASGKFHTLSVWRMGDSETQAADPITDPDAASHKARLSICYDIYSAWHPAGGGTNTVGGKVLARTVAPRKTSWNRDVCCNCEVTKSATQIVAKTGDANTDSLSYTISFSLPATKPNDWTQDMYDNVKRMMQSPSRIGFGTQSNESAFKILEQEGSITAVSVYDVTTGKHLVYRNGTKQSETLDESMITPGSFLYSSLTKKLFYVKGKGSVIPIVLQ